MADQFVEFLRTSDAKLSLTTGKRFIIQVKPGRKAFRAEMEDLLFHFNSAVMLPESPGGQEATQPGKRVLTGLEAMAAALTHAVLHPDRKILATGHADTTGGDADNVKLSDLRARNVLAILIADREDWVETADQRHKVEDYQVILKWVSRRRGWPTDPGAVDGADGPKTRDALQRMQQGYNEEFGKAIAEDGIIGRETWGAVFDLYQDDLAFRMQADAAKMGSIRAKLAFADAGKKRVGCGEHFPVEQKHRDNFKSQANRRVEILFFEPGEEPKLPCHASAGSCDPALCDVYGKGRYIFEPIPETVANGPVNITLQYEDGSPMGLAEFEAHFGEDVVEGITDVNGKAEIQPPAGAGGTFVLKLIDFPESFV